MKIAYVCNEYPPARHGGIGKFVHTLAHKMNDAGHRITVVGLGKADHVRDDHGIRVVTIAHRRLRGASWILSRYRLHRWLSRQVRSGRVDIIEIPDYGGMLPLPFRRCPVVVRLHLAATTIAACMGTALPISIRLAERRTLMYHRNWIAVSRHILELTRSTFRLDSAREALIYNPVTLPAVAGNLPMSKLPQPYVLYVGSLTRRKGAYLLAEAARRFLYECPHLHLVYVGKVPAEHGPAADEQIRSITGSELAKRIHFLGYQDQPTVAECMRKASVFAFPSSLEAFGLVVGEAMLAGTAVVAPDTGPFNEFVTHGETGLLTPPADPLALATAIIRLVQDADLRETLGRNARQAVERIYSVDVCAGKTEQFYRDLLRGFQ